MPRLATPCRRGQTPIASRPPGYELGAGARRSSRLAPRSLLKVWIGKAVAAGRGAVGVIAAEPTATTSHDVSAVTPDSGVRVVLPLPARPGAGQDRTARPGHVRALLRERVRACREQARRGRHRLRDAHEAAASRAAHHRPHRRQRDGASSGRDGLVRQGAQPSRATSSICRASGSSSPSSPPSFGRPACSRTTASRCSSQGPSTPLRRRWPSGGSPRTSAR